MKLLSRVDVTDGLLPIVNKAYIFDVETFAARITLEDEEGVKEIHLPKYELYKALVEVVVSPLDGENDSSDEVMKQINMLKNTPFDFKIAFNTLLNDGIIKYVEND